MTYETCRPLPRSMFTGVSSGSNNFFVSLPHIRVSFCSNIFYSLWLTCVWKAFVQVVSVQMYTNCCRLSIGNSIFFWGGGMLGYGVPRLWMENRKSRKPWILFRSKQYSKNSPSTSFWGLIILPDIKFYSSEGNGDVERKMDFKMRWCRWQN